ncbi:MAG TPA: sarcosine oxidase subunit gamma family protein [Casimicrobiaceae bacterium]
MAERSNIPDAPLTLGVVTLAVAWNIRGDPANAALGTEVSRVLGLPLPADSLTSTGSGSAALLWLGPQSWLYVAGGSSTPIEFDSSRRAINAAGGALFDVSSSYVAWRVAGANAARTLNRACPLDLHPRVFRTGQCAQSVLGHVHALFHKPDDGSFVVIVARSFAADAWRTLCEAATTDGYRIVSACPFAYAMRST